ncbi:MAG: RluA family pseudouridine synthase [Planctomycetes bacterium]|nr:RluA family pseudouridine synthase [Planctomycetota bacterium]
MAARLRSDQGSGGGDLSRLLHPGVVEVFRDAVLWLLDKPAGVLSHPNRSGSAANALLRAPYDFSRELYRAEESGGRSRQVYLVHRLDLETSGLILCAFRPEAALALKEALHDREVQKEYLAVLLGTLPRDEGEWEDRLEKRSGKGRADVSVQAKGRPNARSAFRILQRFPRAGATLAALRPSTGRTHQLRVQAASRGHPIAGDERYGDFAANRFLAREIGLKRMFLHAWRLEFRHPETRHLMKFQRDPSPRLSGPLERLSDLSRPIPRRPRERSR